MARVLILAAGLLTVSVHGVLAQSLPAAGLTVPADPLAIRVAYFSPQRAFSESAEGKAAETRLSTLQAEKERAVAEKSKALQTQQQALEASGSLLSESVRLQRGKELERLKIDLQRFVEDAEAELTAIQREIQAAFLAKLEPAVEQVAKERGLQFVLNADQGTIVWADASFDITAEVVRRLAAAQTQKDR
jgi:outer membrane protein